MDFMKYDDESFFDYFEYIECFMKASRETRLKEGLNNKAQTDSPQRENVFSLELALPPDQRLGLIFDMYGKNLSNEKKKHLAIWSVAGREESLPFDEGIFVKRHPQYETMTRLQKKDILKCAYTLIKKYIIKRINEISAWIQTAKEDLRDFPNITQTFNHSIKTDIILFNAARNAFNAEYNDLMDEESEDKYWKTFGDSGNMKLLNLCQFLYIFADIKLY